MPPPGALISARQDELHAADRLEAGAINSTTVKVLIVGAGVLQSALHLPGFPLSAPSSHCSLLPAWVVPSPQNGTGLQEAAPAPGPAEPGMAGGRRRGRVGDGDVLRAVVALLGVCLQAVAAAGVPARAGAHAGVPVGRAHVALLASGVLRPVAAEPNDPARPVALGQAIRARMLVQSWFRRSRLPPVVAGLGALFHAVVALITGRTGRILHWVLQPATPMAPACRPGPRRTPRWPASSGRRRTGRSGRPWCRRCCRRRCRCSGRRVTLLAVALAVVAAERGGPAGGRALARAIRGVRVRRALVTLFTRVHLAVATTGRRGQVRRSGVDLLVGGEIDRQFHVRRVAAAGTAGARCRPCRRCAARAAGVRHPCHRRAAGGAATRAAGGAAARAAGGAAASAAAEAAAGRGAAAAAAAARCQPAASARALLGPLAFGSAQPGAVARARPAASKTCTAMRRRDPRTREHFSTEASGACNMIDPPSIRCVSMARTVPEGCCHPSRKLSLHPPFRVNALSL